MSWIDDLFGGGREQAGKDMYNQEQQGMNDSGQFFNPYIQRGNSAYQDFINQLQQGQDPVALYNKYSSQYKMSPEAQAQIATGQKNANNAAAASGMLGSGAEQTAAANLSQSVRSEDFDKYMQNIFGLRNQYLGGMGGLENQGFEASQNDAKMRQKYYEDMAQAKAGEDMGRAGGIEGLFSKGLGIAGSLFGGPIGGTIGNYAGNYLFGGGMGNSGDPHSSGWQDPGLQQPF